MTKSLSAFTPIAGSDDLWSAQKGTLRCTAFRLQNGDIGLYSPVLGLSDAARDSLADLGKVGFLIAPNHYHHKGLAEYAEVFSDAEILCSDQAKPRLEKQTGLTFAGLSSLEQVQLRSMEVLHPEGLKTGEVWLAVTVKEERIWIVTDAFKGAAGPTGTVTEHVELLGTFPTFGIKDRTTYREWLSQRIVAAPPTMIVPCHGSIASGPSVASRALALISNPG